MDAKRYGVSINIWFLTEDKRPRKNERVLVLGEDGEIELAVYHPEQNQYITTQGVVVKAKAFSFLEKEIDWSQGKITGD